MTFNRQGLQERQGKQCGLAKNPNTAALRTSTRNPVDRLSFYPSLDDFVFIGVLGVSSLFVPGSGGQTA